MYLYHVQIELSLSIVFVLLYQKRILELIESGQFRELQVQNEKKNMRV